MSNNIKLIIYIPFLLLFGFVLIQYINFIYYPNEWEKIKIGVHRYEIHQKLGDPTVGELWDIKGDIWFENDFLSWHRLDIVYTTDTLVYAHYHSFYLGTKTHYFRHSVK